MTSCSNDFLSELSLKNEKKSQFHAFFAIIASQQCSLIKVLVSLQSNLHGKCLARQTLKAKQGGKRWVIVWEWSEIPAFQKVFLLSTCVESGSFLSIKGKILVPHGNSPTS